MKQDTNTILHLGLGAFHRAHQADYLQDLHDRGDKLWQIVGGNIRPFDTEVIDALIANRGKYTLETVDDKGNQKYRSIDVITEVIPWQEDISDLIKIACRSEVKIISFTVTEAGYYLDNEDSLQIDNNDVNSDITSGTHLTLYGALAKMLSARMRELDQPLTLLCCDNLQGNGNRFRNGFYAFLSATDNIELLEWVKSNTSTPNSMVDRITPKPTLETIQRINSRCNVDDPAAIMSESFKQWVIEDDFVAGRPEWEVIGVELVDDVEPYEKAKIRLLNATHSCVAWAGVLAGYEKINEAVADPQIREFAYRYITDNAISVLSSEKQLNLEEYRDHVLVRFSNKYIPDTCSRILTDSSAKLTGFVLPTIRESLQQGLNLTSLFRLPAFYLLFLIKYSKGEINAIYNDQALDKTLLAELSKAEDPVNFFTSQVLFFEDLAGSTEILSAMRLAFDDCKNIFK